MPAAALVIWLHGAETATASEDVSSRPAAAPVDARAGDRHTEGTIAVASLNDALAAAASEGAGREMETRIRVAGWLAGAKGGVDVGPFRFDYDRTAFEIMAASDTAFGASGDLEFRFPRFHLRIGTDLIVAEARRQRVDVGPVVLEADPDYARSSIELEVGWNLIDRPLDDGRVRLDLYGGARLTRLESRATLSADVTIVVPPGIPVSRAGTTVVRDDEAWVEPFVGLRVDALVAHSIVLRARGDIGGFGVAGTTAAWRARGEVGWRIELADAELLIYAGYGAIEQRTDRGRLDREIIFHGPTVGIEIVF